MILNQRQTWLVVGMSCVIVTGHCLMITYNAQQQTITEEQSVTKQLRVEPDSIKANGNLVTTVGKDYCGKKYLLSLRFDSRTKLQELVNIKQPVTLLVDGTIQPIEPATNENQFNGQRYYRLQKTYNVVRGTSVIKQLERPQGAEVLHQLRANLMHYFKTFPAPLSLFCNRLLLGASDNELGETIRQVQTLGIIHLFCLSGLHVTVICQMIRHLLSIFNLTRERINHIQTILLPMFWLIGGASTSLTRAVLMLEIGLLNERRCQNHDTWSLGLLIHLLFNPGVLLNLGGQLSYLLSFALCRIQWRSIWKQTVELNIVSLPILFNATYQVHLLTLVLNYVMIPLFSWVILPVVISCAMLGNWFPQYLELCNHGLLAYQHLLKWLSACPGLIIFGKIPNWVTLLLIVLSLLACERAFCSRWVWRSLIVCYLIVFCWIRFPIHGEVTFFDIGQGDSILIRTPFNRQVMLIDTGGRLKFKVPLWKKYASNNDGATRISVNYLKSKGIGTIDAVFLSHSDADHIGYISTICRELKIKIVVVPAGMERMTKFTKRIPAGTRVLPVTNQTDLSPLPLQVLHPFRSGQGKNEDSMVLYGHFGAKSFIFSGDLDRQGERRVIKRYPQLKADVVKLGHHGSKTASDPKYLKQLAPELVIISAGRHNRYGHPNQETIITLQRQRIPFWSTQKRGMIQYNYYSKKGSFKTKLQGDEFNWMR